MAIERPDRTIRDALERHREANRRGSAQVVEKYEKALSYIPDEVEPFVGPSLGSLDYTTSDYVSVDKRNYSSRVEEGAKVVVRFGSGGGKGYAIGTVTSAPDSKNNEGVVEIGGHTVSIKGWQISGVFPET